MKNEVSKLEADLASVVLYRNVSRDGVLAKLGAFLRACESESDAFKTEKYCDFVSSLYESGCDLGEYIEDALRCSDNIYVRTYANAKNIPDVMQACFENELKLFSRLTFLTSEELLSYAELPLTLPSFNNTKKDFAEIIPRLLKSSNKLGYGIYARYGMFRVTGEGNLSPVLSPDPITLSSLIGYEEERRKVLDNTRALLRGLPAANVLLCGDAGTGKSSTVKAVANELRDEGIRLIELRKEQLPLLPEIMGQIADNPLKFILFIDDLSFACDDDGFGALKAILEGSAAAKTSNAVIYATSNRRHIVKETFSSRDGDDIHRRDSMEEMLSLSARFGLSITFTKPNKDLYLKIVHSLAWENNIICDANLDRLAEAFALSKGGRSARVASQFIDNLISTGE